MHGELWPQGRAPFCVSANRGSRAMSYRVYVGPPGTEKISPLEKDQLLFKEFASLDDAFGWARHVNGSGRVTLAIDGDDGTCLDKSEVAAALRHPESLGGDQIH